MTAALGHRGPDSSGVWRSEQGDLALGHARLAIVDLSEQGRQPMASRSGRFVVVFNGEIYNHLELRPQLAADAAWRGHSDTETLLAAIERYGLQGALDRLVGMFALAVWDRRDGSLSLARDRMGEKPLYCAWGRHGFAFASEIKALRRCTGLDLTLDREALREFVQYGYISGQRSAFLGIRKLLPASMLTVRGAALEPGPATRYWHLPRPTGAASAAGPAADAERLAGFDALLQTSIRQQMLSDVPLGAFLSGGIDSSLIVALMQRNASQPVKTFTMGFDGGGQDELLAARDAARLLGTEHTELRVTPDDVLATIPTLARIYDEPFADASQVPTVLLSQLTRRHVTVALSGDAGDELFGGYNRYLFAAKVEAAFRGWPLWLRRAVGRALLTVPSRAVEVLAQQLGKLGLRSVPPALGEKVARLAQFIAAPSWEDAYRGTLSQWTVNASNPLIQAAPEPDLAPYPGIPGPQQMMCWDMQGYLPDDILVKVDRAAMASSLETRIPFLDHRLVEFALATPLHQKIRAGRSKWLPRELLARHLPRTMFERPKQGFSIPLDTWLRGPLRDWAEDLLATHSLRQSGLVDPEQVRSAWHEHLGGQRNHQRALWTVLMLQAWLREFESALQTSGTTGTRTEPPAGQSSAVRTAAPC